MPISKALATRFIQLLMDKRYAEAGRGLERFKRKMQKTEWNRGYFQALSGMLLVRRSNSNDAFFLKVDFSDNVALKKHQQEFLGHVKNRLHDDFDRGFFSAWVDGLRILMKMNSVNAKSSAEKKLKDLKRKNQITIENFLKKEA